MIQIEREQRYLLEGLAEEGTMILQTTQFSVLFFAEEKKKSERSELPVDIDSFDFRFDQYEVGL